MSVLDCVAGVLEHTLRPGRVADALDEADRHMEAWVS